MNTKLFNQISLKIKGLTKVFSEGLKSSVKKTVVFHNKKAIQVVGTVVKRSARAGLMGYIPRIEVVIQLPAEYAEVIKDYKVHLQTPVNKTAEVVNTVADQLGWYPVFTKPSSVKKIWSYSAKEMVHEIKYYAVDRDFVTKHGGLAAKGEEGIAAVLNFLSNGKLPVNYHNVDRSKLGAFSKYLNHDWSGTLQDVYVCVLPKKVEVLGVEADGHAYMPAANWDRVISGFGELPWKQAKIADLKSPRMIKPVILGNVFGKGTLVPLSDVEWSAMFPGMPHEVKGLPVIVGDKNFCKLVDPSVKPNSKGNTWVSAKLGLHDSPMFGIKKVDVAPSTLVRMSLTQSQIEMWGNVMKLNTQELEMKILSEGPEFLAFRNLNSDSDIESDFILDRDAWLTQAIFRSQDAKKAREEAMAGLLERVAAVPAYQFSGYAVAPMGELAEMYADGTVSHLDCFINPLDLEEFLGLEGHRELVSPDTLYVIGRFPAISPLAFNQGKLIPSYLVPRRGVVVHPYVWLTKSGDMDGDTVNIRLYPDLTDVGHTYSLEEIQSIPLAKGANASEFSKGNYASIMVQQVYCQSATGMVDTAALSAVMNYTNNSPAVVPDWTAFEQPAEDLQTLLTGAKKAVELPSAPVKGKDLWLKILTGKDAGWQQTSASQVIENLFKLDRKGNLRNSHTKYTNETFINALEYAVELAFTIEVKVPEYGFAASSNKSVPLLSELRSLDAAMRPDGLHYAEGAHALAVETIRLYIARTFRKPAGGNNPAALKDALASYISFVVDMAADAGAREAALHWAQKLLGEPLSQVVPELCYHLVVKPGNQEDAP